MRNIKIDYNFVMKKSIKNGMSENELKEHLKYAEIGYGRLKKLIESGEVGFNRFDAEEIESIKNYSKKVKGKFNDLIVVGIGGSSLGLESIVDALLPFGYNNFTFAERGCYPRIWVADNVDPFKINWIMKSCVPSDTLLCVISKSGGTVETIANFNIFYSWLMENLEKPEEHIVVITDPKRGFLRKWASEKGVVSFDIPENVGGRFSVFTSVGLLPAALLGIDIDKLIDGAKSFMENCIDKALLLAAIYIYFIKNGVNQSVIMPYSSRLEKFSSWFVQLWAESLGKRYNMNNEEVNFGPTPIKSIGAVDQHSLLQLLKEGPYDKVITFIEIENHDFDKKIKNVFDDGVSYLLNKKLSELLNIELHATELALKNAYRPNLKITLDVLDESTFGSLLIMFMYCIPIIGLYFDINPFDQPGVEEGKNYAYGMLGRKGFENFKKSFDEGYDKLNDFTV